MKREYIKPSIVVTSFSNEVSIMTTSGIQISTSVQADISELDMSAWHK